MTLSLTAFALVTACVLAATALGALIGLVHLRPGRPLRDCAAGGEPADQRPAAAVTRSPASHQRRRHRHRLVQCQRAGRERRGDRLAGLPAAALLPLGRLRAYVIVGVVWAFWHAPLVLLGYDDDDAGRVTALLALAVFCILCGTLLVWLRNRSDSLTGQAASAG